MTARDRVSAALNGDRNDRQPVISLSTADADADVLVVSDVEWVSKLSGSDQSILVEVGNPYATSGSEILRHAKGNPEESARTLESALDGIRSRVDAAFEAGADGIFYRLQGATAAQTTPMEYGGLFLEHDRELLASVMDRRLTVLYLEGDSDLYFDFVCDLPAHVIAWDCEGTGYNSQMVRALRPGPQASSDPASEFALSLHGVRPA